MTKVSLAGIPYPDSTGDLGITDVTDPLDERGWFVEGHRQYMADYWRAAADVKGKAPVYACNPLNSGTG